MKTAEVSKHLFLHSLSLCLYPSPILENWVLAKPIQGKDKVTSLPSTCEKEDIKEKDNDVDLKNYWYTHFIDPKECSWWHI